MRRLILEEPFSRSALLSRRLAAFAVAVALIGVAAARAGLDPPAALAVLGGSIGLAAAAVVCALLAFVFIWRTGRQGAGQATAGLLLALLLVAYPAYLVAKMAHTPRLTDFSTDLADPPIFSTSRAALAARGGATPQSLPTAKRRAQAAAFPKILPILLDLEGNEAYAAVLKAVAASGWKIVEQTPPGGRMGIGHIDAIARSMILGFPSDITIRVRPLTDQTRVDIRSASRFGPFDFGVNQRNIAVFEASLEAQVDKK
ncbi:DUF1499 domain-containing protein [Methylocella silvestris]|uniref:DUF1499 domain-containing protein n=1 Tax=Methylocella silvestris TaxID=199596 RepID=A0A2J7TE03_METSI|nr:DUF1499 domain-containing protein [Methylocella silvestris]PNG24979.1 hypothetical protein CR492_15875 [Methylocella silvestris]